MPRRTPEGEEKGDITEGGERDEECCGRVKLREGVDGVGVDGLSSALNGGIEVPGDGGTAEKANSKVGDGKYGWVCPSFSSERPIERKKIMHHPLETKLFPCIPVLVSLQTIHPIQLRLR